MPDNDTTTPPEPEIIPAVEPVAVEPAAAEPHPLDPGGKRFNEVYRDMREATRRADALEAEVNALKAKAAPPAAAQTFYTPGQLQTMVDAGQVTPALMAAQLAWQQGQQVKAEVRQEMQIEGRITAAKREVSEYVAKLPKLLDETSPEFRRAHQAAIDVAEDMGLKLDDPRVQRRALREAFGQLDRVTAVQRTNAQAASNADTYVETGGGGGGQTNTVAADPLKSVPGVYLEHWKQLGYTREQMIEEAQYITPRAARKLAGLV